MRRRTRVAVFTVAALGLAALLGWSLAGLPAFGEFESAYSTLLKREALPERHTTNVVTAIVFDYRGLDTLGEEFILFGAVIGVTLLLRRGTEDEDEERLLREAPDDRTRSDAVRVIGLLAVPPLFVLGLWLVAFGLVTPGGGFQGGVVLAGAILLVFVAGGFRSYKRLTRMEYVDFAEGAGTAAFTLIGICGLLTGGAYLENFLGPGVTGTLESGGSLPLLNWATAVAVCAAMLLLFSEFVERYVVPRMGEKR